MYLAATEWQAAIMIGWFWVGRKDESEEVRHATRFLLKAWSEEIERSLAAVPSHTWCKANEMCTYSSHMTKAVCTNSKRCHGWFWVKPISSFLSGVYLHCWKSFRKVFFKNPFADIVEVYCPVRCKIKMFRLFICAVVKGLNLRALRSKRWQVQLLRLLRNRQLDLAAIQETKIESDTDGRTDRQTSLRNSSSLVSSWCRGEACVLLLTYSWVPWMWKVYAAGAFL